MPDTDRRSGTLKSHSAATMECTAASTEHDTPPVTEHRAELTILMSWFGLNREIT